MSTQSQDKFKEEQIVWVKLTGYPWWPAYILSIDNLEETLFTVLFIGEESHCQANLKNIKNYEENKNKFLSQKVKKNKEQKFKSSVVIAEKIKSGELEINDHMKYINFKPDGNIFMNHYDNIMKSVRENIFYNKHRRLDDIKTDEITEEDIKENNINPQNFTHKDNQNLKNENNNFCKEGREESPNITENVDETKLLRKKRGRKPKKLTEVKGKQNARNEISKKEEKINHSNNTQEVTNEMTQKLKIESNIEANTTELDINYKLKNPENNIPSLIHHKIPNEECIKDSTGITIIEAEAKVSKNETRDKNLSNKITDLLLLLKSDVNSINANLTKIDSDMNAIDEYLRSLFDSQSISPNDLLSTFAELKVNYQSLFEHSIKTNRIVKNGLENSNKLYLSHKHKENSTLIEEIEKFKKMIATEISGEKNSNITYEKEDNLAVNESLLKYKNLWKFLKEILYSEFEMNLPMEFLTLDNFKNNIIKGSYLMESIRKIPNISLSREKEKLRTKVKLQMENILSQTLGDLGLPKLFINNLTIFLELQAAQKDGKFQKGYKDTIINILKQIKESLVLNEMYLYDP